MSEESVIELQKRVAATWRELGVNSRIDLERFDNLIELIEHAFREHADEAAFTSLGHTITFAELDDLSGQFASYLEHHTGLEMGDRIAVQLPNLVQYPVVVLGALRAGLVVVNTNPMYSERELRHQLQDSGARALVVLEGMSATAAAVLRDTGVEHVVMTQPADLHPPLRRWLLNTAARYLKGSRQAAGLEHAVHLRAALALGGERRFTWIPTHRDSLALLQYTGGTTGVAKGARLSHGNLVANVLQVDEYMASQPQSPGREVLMQPLPTYHIYAFMTCVFSMVNGFHMVFIPDPRNQKDLIKRFRQYRPSVFFGLNTLFAALCAREDFRRLDFSQLKVTMSGGMALSHAAAQHWESITGCGISEGYGLTETSPVVAANPGNRRVLGTIGLPLPGTRVKLVNDAGEPVPMGEPGELCVQGPQVMQGYWNRPEDTAAVLDERGWFHTGDIALIREDGYLKIVDRKKDMILVSGFNVYPNELEDVLYEHDDVVECAAVGVPDEETGEAVRMYVVSRSGQLTVEAVRDLMRRSLTAYKVPKQVVFRDELPKSNVGKILRRELKEPGDA